MRRVKAAFLHWVHHPAYAVFKHLDCSICRAKYTKWMS